MGWPFQLKFIWSALFKEERSSLSLVLFLLAGLSFFHFLLLQVLIKVISLKLSFFIIFSIGSLVNLNACLMTILSFKAHSFFVKEISAKKIAIFVKVGRKITFSLLATYLLLLAHHATWTQAYSYASTLFLFYAIFSVFLGFYVEKLSFTQKKKAKKTFFSSLSFKEKFLLVTHDKTLWHTSLLFLSINIGHHLLTSWTAVFLRESGFTLVDIAHQRYLSLLSYTLGVLYSYFLCQKKHYQETIFFASLIYTLTLFFLAFTPSSDLLAIKALLFLKSLMAASLLILKYSWLTSYCAQHRQSVLFYSFMMSLSNSCSFMGSFLGGLMMANFSWSTLFVSAALLNIPGLVFLLFYQKSSFLKQLRLV